MRELVAITDEAEQNGLRFLIIGGLAVSAYGHVRSTADADFAIPRRDLDAWKGLLSKFGYSLAHELIRLEHLDVNAEDFRVVCRDYGTPELDHEIRKRLQT